MMMMIMYAGHICVLNQYTRGTYAMLAIMK